MNLQPLYDVKERLEYAAVAGVSLLGEDFRLKRAVEGLKPLAASPVFGKIDSGLTKLLSAPTEQRAGLLLDVLALVDAVTYTQAKTGGEGDLEPLPTGGGVYHQISYGQINPLLTALTTTGGGRMEVIQAAWEAHPEFFADFRILPVVVADLGDSYGEISELNAKILKNVGPAALPLLKQGFDPAGKKEMARRVEVISAIQGPEAAAWLKELLPQAKKDVRIAVLTALGGDPDNAALLLALVKTERGKNRDAVLTALSHTEGEAVRDFWQNEIAKEPESLSFLQKSSTEWAADLVASGMRARLENAMYERRIVTREMKAELQSWCAALRGGKASPAMLDFWRWVDEHFDDIRRLESVGNQNFRLTSHMTARLMESLDAAGPGPLAELCLELWEKDKDSARWLPHAVVAALLTLPAAAVYEKFSPYILTGELPADIERKKPLNDAVFHVFGAMYLDKSQRRYMFAQLDLSPAEPLDPRWIERFIHAACKPSGGKYYPFGGEDALDQLDRNLMALADPSDPDQCAQIIPYIRRRMVETGSWYNYSRYLLRFGGSLRGILGEAMKNGKPAQLFYVWSLLNAVSQDLPAEETAALCQEILDTKWICSVGVEGALAELVIPQTIQQLQEGKPFPSWDDWWGQAKDVAIGMLS